LLSRVLTRTPKRRHRPVTLARHDLEGMNGAELFLVASVVVIVAFVVHLVTPHGTTR
jgi:hypothetical protein